MCSPIRESSTCRPHDEHFIVCRKADVRDMSAGVSLPPRTVVYWAGVEALMARIRENMGEVWRREEGHNVVQQRRVLRTQGRRGEMFG